MRETAYISEIWFRFCYVWTCFACAFGIAAAAGNAAAETDRRCAPTVLQSVRVAAVVDAQTLLLEGGGEVRLIGALAPEAPAWWKRHKPWPPSEEARRALERLTASAEIELRFAPNEPERDRHARFLAQVFARSGGEEVWVQGHMVGEGYALAYSFPGHRACARRLQRLENAARTARKGLWRRGAYVTLSADKTAEILERRGRYQLVEGSVVAVGNTRGWTFLNFADDWKRDFTVAVRAGNRRQFDGTDVELGKLEGRRVRVRGWIERWNGPVIKATHPEQIEVLEE